MLDSVTWQCVLAAGLLDLADGIYFMSETSTNNQQLTLRNISQETRFKR